MEIDCISCDAKVKANFVYGDNVARFCPSCGSSKITVDYTAEELRYQEAMVQEAKGTPEVDTAEQVAYAPAPAVDKCEAPREPEHERLSFKETK